LHKIKQRGIPILIIWLNPSGENKELEKLLGALIGNPCNP
jgi:hypothetical protein